MRVFRFCLSFPLHIEVIASRPHLARRLLVGDLDRLAKLADARAVLGGDRQRLAKAEHVGLVDAGLGGAALAFVGCENDRLARAAHEIGEHLVGADQSCPRVDEKHYDIGLLYGRLGLLPHACGKPGIAGFEPRGVDQRHVVSTERRLGLAPVAGQAGLIVDQRQALAGQSVEHSGLADIRASDDGDGEGHLSVREKNQ